VVQVSSWKSSSPAATRLRSLLADHFGSADWNTGAGAIRRRKSTVLRARSASLGLEVAVKVFDITSAGDERRAVRQYEALQKFHPLLKQGDGRYRVPAPHAFFPEQYTLIMEWIDAPSLARLLFTRMAMPGRRLDAVAEAGRWLRRYHEASELKLAPLDAAHFVRRLQQRFNARPDLERLLDRDPVLVKTARRLHDQAATLQGIAVTTALNHGDFTPFNLLVAPQRVTGIDFWGRPRGPVATDLARMLVYLLMLDPLSPIPGRDGAALLTSPAARTLLSAYGTDVLPGPEVLSCVLRYQALSRWWTLCSRPGNFWRLWIPHFRARLVRLMEDLNDREAC
jgi:hypothetical protein